MSKSEATASPEFYNEKQLAELLGVSVQKLALDRSKARGVPYVKFGRSVRYSSRAVAEFIAKHTVGAS